jgi:hypothetical protein
MKENLRLGYYDEGKKKIKRDWVERLFDEFSKMVKVEWGDMKWSFSYSLVSPYVISILMSLHNKRDRERWGGWRRRIETVEIIGF